MNFLECVTESSSRGCTVWCLLSEWGRVNAVFLDVPVRLVWLGSDTA